MSKPELDGQKLSPERRFVVLLDNGYTTAAVLLFHERSRAHRKAMGR